MPLAEMKISVRKQVVGEDPTVEIYHVELSTGRGVWTETFGHESHLHAFLRGVEAGLGVMGIFIPEALFHAHDSSPS